MKQIKTIDDAIFAFTDAAKNHAESSNIGDYKLANKSYKQIKSAADFLKEKNEIDVLVGLLNDNSYAVRLWAATYLLPIKEQTAVSVLESIMKLKQAQSFEAKWTLKEWFKKRKG